MSRTLVNDFVYNSVKVEVYSRSAVPHLFPVDFAYELPAIGAGGCGFMSQREAERAAMRKVDEQSARVPGMEMGGDA